MISNNYVPEWYISPFEHSKYTLVRNQDQFDLLFDDVGDTQEFLHLGTGAQVDYYDGGKHCVVQLGDCSERTLIMVHGLLLHEAVHIWQRIKKLMREDEPSIEFEAYSIQRIAQDLFSMFEESEVSDVLDKRQIVEQALEELGLASYVFDMQPEQVESAKRKLDSMMALWDSKGIRFSYPLSSDANSGDLDQETFIPDYAVEAVVLNLAIRLAGAFGKVVPVETKAMAKDGFETIQLAMLSNPPRVQLDPSLPCGAGHKSTCHPFIEKTCTKTVFAPDTSVSFSNE